MFAQRLAGHSTARITRALNDAGVPCPSAADPARNPHRTGYGVDAAARWRPSWPTRGTPAGRCGTGSAPRRTWPTRPTPGWATGRYSGGTCPTAGSSPPGPRMRRWSARTASSPPRTPCRAAPVARLSGRAGQAPVPAGRAARLRDVRAAAGIGLVQRQARLPVPPRHTQAPPSPDPHRPKNAYLREDQILPHLAALHLCSPVPDSGTGRAPDAAPTPAAASPRTLIG